MIPPETSQPPEAEGTLEGRVRLAALGADVGTALAQVAALPKALQQCADAIVRNLNVAFARIWTLSVTDNVLELQSSAGLYTHLNGPHSRVPVGAFKIGRIAEERQPHLTNDVAHDPRISNPEWAAREKMVAFAGYPLIVDEKLVGVLALFSCTPLTNDTMRALQSISVSIAVGIERKRAEMALVESERRYRFLAESMPQMVWTASPGGELDYVNSQATNYFGLPASSLLGSGWLAGVYPDDREKVTKLWQHSLATGEIYDTEFRLRRGSDGEWRWFLVRAHTMASTEGKVVSWLGTCTDIHGQKKDQEALHKANRELEEFAYVASHDLQEPLRMVNIYTQLILRRVDVADSTLAQFAGFVAQGVYRMESLLTDLLSFSRSVHADSKPNSVADLSLSLKQALEALEARIEETSAVIQIDSLPNTRGETGQMAHVFQNLIANSLKYRSEAPPLIQISSQKAGEDWVVTVQDNGIGFEPRYAERIFGLFKRLHKEEYPGTGLGLAICKRIVERYGGKMWAESILGRGAAFYFSLPGAD